MEQYLSGNHHISLKQIPSGLILRKAGSPSVGKNHPILLDAGFAIEEYTSDGKRNFYQQDDGGKVREIPAPYRPSSNLGMLLGLEDDSELESFKESIADSVISGSGTADGTYQVKSKITKRLVYGNFFKIIAGRFLTDIQGQEGPRVLVWAGDVQRLTDPLSPKLFDWKRFGLKQPKNKICFQDVKNIDVQMHFLYSHTHWGNKILQLCKEDEDLTTGWSTPHTMKKVLRAFLSGQPDPRWTTEFTAKIYKYPEKVRKRSSRAARLLEVLKTIDGVFAQRFCAFPHEDWDYEKYDIFVLKILWELISDEFLDGELTENGMNITTRYSELKAARGEFKHASARGNVGLINKTSLFNKTARWLRFLLPLYKEFDQEEDSMRKTFLHDVLSQTRGAGKPPPLCKLQAKIKFLHTVTIPDNVPSVNLKIIRQCVSEILHELPDHIFTGLATKSSINVNNNACFEYTKRDGATLLAIQDITKGYESGIPVEMIDLETGEPGEILYPRDSNPGTYIWWACLRQVLRMTPQERAEASLVVVDEPGKDRAITKARACVKIVLDWINKICSVPLERGFESSHGGMKLANHTWNLFKDSDTEALREVLFSVKSTKREAYNSHIRTTKVYDPVYAISMDYETATDFQSHQVGKIIGYSWMTKCGIPRVLRNLVCEIAYNPRTIYYHGNFGIGEEVDSTENLWKITTSRGVLMGDPLTKVILHFDNIIARRLSFRLLQEDFYEKAFGFSYKGKFQALKMMLVKHGINLDLLPKTNVL
jgi:hypothetical protein